MRAIPRLAFIAGAATAGLALGLPAASYAETGSAGNTGTASGNQAQAPVRAPVDVCGNGIGVLGVGRGGDCADGYSHNRPTPSDCPSSGTGYGRSSGDLAGSSSRTTGCAGAPDPTPSSSSHASPSTSARHEVPVGAPSSDAGGPPEDAPVLPVTGTSLTILTGSAVTLLAGGVGVLVLARRRRV